MCYVLNPSWHSLSFSLVDNSLIGPELVQETTDKVFLIRKKLKATRNRQKSYANNRRKPIKFKVGDQVLFKVLPWKGVMHFGKKCKLAPRYVEPFEILERIGHVAYRLRLPKELSEVHDTFHVSNLKKCLADDSLHVPLDEIKIDTTLHFVEEPVKIMDREVKTLTRSKLSIVKVCWILKRGSKFTWEREDHMKARLNSHSHCSYTSRFHLLLPTQYSYHDVRLSQMVVCSIILLMDLQLSQYLCNLREVQNETSIVPANPKNNRILVGVLGNANEKLNKTHNEKRMIRFKIDK
nr:putative reverse transcriptase domain-containing protein [Tanacetum cinerariifolium]